MQHGIERRRVKKDGEKAWKKDGFSPPRLRLRHEGMRRAEIAMFLPMSAPKTSSEPGSVSAHWHSLRTLTDPTEDNGEPYFPQTGVSADAEPTGCTAGRELQIRVPGPGGNGILSAPGAAESAACCIVQKKPKKETGMAVPSRFLQFSRQSFPANVFARPAPSAVHCTQSSAKTVCFLRRSVHDFLRKRMHLPW